MDIKRERERGRGERETRQRQFISVGLRPLENIREVWGGGGGGEDNRITKDPTWEPASTESLQHIIILYSKCNDTSRPKKRTSNLRMLRLTGSHFIVLHLTCPALLSSLTFVAQKNL